MNRTMTLLELAALFSPLPPEHNLPHPVIVLDTETTELPPKPSALDPDKRGSAAASVCEIGAILLGTDGMPRDRLHLVIIPDEWPEEPGLSRALAVSGLTREQIIREGMTVEDARQTLRAWWPKYVVGGQAAWSFVGERSVWGGCAEAGLIPWVAFNTGFDSLMLERTFCRHDRNARLPPTCGCIMLAAKAAMEPRGLLNPSPEWAQKRGDLWQFPKASAAMDAFGVVREHVHAALPDAADEALVLCAMARQGLSPWSTHAR